eukprot:m.35969 g.35969  ORF g.35969 m.35969 type:complete len:252 (+) comp11215_c0_seq1:234-989(+)
MDRAAFDKLLADTKTACERLVQYAPAFQAEMVCTKASEMIHELTALQQQRSRKRQTVCRHFARTGHCQLGSTCGFLHDKPPVCRHFERTGDCRYASKCRFSHDVSVAGRARLEERAQQQEAEAQQRQQQREEAQRKQWQEEGWTELHQAAFYGKCVSLCELLEQQTLDINARTRQPHRIEWSEYDAVDRTFDHQEITFPINTTPLDVARSKCSDVNGIAVVMYMADSHHGRDDRQKCIKMLLDPKNARTYL